METLKTLFKELERDIEKLNYQALNGIGYVGSANYSDRQREAESWVEDAKNNVDATMYKIQMELNKTAPKIPKLPRVIIDPNGEMITYCHAENTNFRFRQYKKDFIPTWATDIQPLE